MRLAVFSGWLASVLFSAAYMCWGWDNLVGTALYNPGRHPTTADHISSVLFMLFRIAFTSTISIIANEIYKHETRSNRGK